MAVTIGLKEFKDCLDVVVPFVADRDIVPALQYLCFKGNKIIAYSGTAGATITTPWAFGPEAFAVAAAPLLKTVSSFIERGYGELTYSLKEQGAPFVVKAGKSTYKLPTLTKEQMSEFVLREPPTGTARSEVAMEFWADVARVELSVSKNETMPALRGVFWGPKGHLMSSDSKRLSMVSPRADQRFMPPGESGVLIPDYLLQRLGAKKMQVTSMMIDGGVLWFFMENAAIWGSMLSSDFPGDRCLDIIKDLRKTVAMQGSGTWVGLGDGGRVVLRNALDLMLFFTDSHSNELRGKILRNVLQLQSGRTGGVEKDNGEAEDVIEVKTQGPGGEFSVDGKLFGEVLGYEEMTRFWFAGNKALYFLSSEKPPRFEHMVLLLVTPTEARAAHAEESTTTAAEDDAY